MKFILNIFIKIIIVFIILTYLDLFWIFNFNTPILAIKEDNGDSVNIVYRGIFYDTYNCQEFSSMLIKSKGSKYNCIVINDKEN